MDELPPFRAMAFPSYLQPLDAFAQIPIEALTDEQARAVWRGQEEAFVAHVRKRRTAKPMGLRASTPWRKSR